jgi:nucleoside-diphosphate-sugar epimerase
MERIELSGKNIFVTGAAGFIGSNLVKRLFKDVPTATIIGIDNMNDYYDVRLKEARLKELNANEKFVFVKGDIADKSVIDCIFAEYKPAVVVNLAAQAGVRYSITNPDAYIQSNLIGFYNILEACRHSYDNGEKGVESYNVPDSVDVRFYLTHVKGTADA